MRRLIINNESRVSDNRAIALVAAVINKGKISNNGSQYCYVTTFATAVVYADRTRKGTHTFKVIDP